MKVTTVAALLLFIPMVLSAQTSSAPQSSDAGGQTPTISQPSKPQTPLERFKAGDLTAKAKILEASAGSPIADSGPLLLQAFSYLTSNLTILRSEQEAQRIALVAVQQAGQHSFSAAAEPVWQLFQFSSNQEVRLASLNTLAIIGGGVPDVVNKMNHWLAGRNLLHLSDSPVDTKVVGACVKALVAIADASSFQVLFSTMEAGYGEAVTNDARNGLSLVKGDRAKQYLTAVETSRFGIRPVALTMAMADTKLSTAEKGPIAEAALKSALSPDPALQVTPAMVAKLRFPAVQDLGELRWTPAASLVLTNFNRAATEYAEGKLEAKELILSVNALAAMGTHEAAVRLSLYLGLINSRTSSGKSVDQELPLAVVQALGELGDRAAFDNLYEIRYLDYPHAVKAAAQSALSSLSSQ